MIFNEIKCRVNTSIGLVGGVHPPLWARLLEGFWSRLGLEGFGSRDFEYCKETVY